MCGDDEESLRRILVLGSDDWITLDEVIWECAEGHKDELGRERVERVLRRMFHDDLFVPGELEESGFVDWHGGPADWMGTIMTLIIEHNWWLQGTGPWLRITDKGEQFAVE